MVAAPDVPEYLQHALRWLRRVLPNGLPEALYPAVLSVLYNEFSDRNLAQLIAAHTGRDAAIVLNDIYRVINVPPSEQDVERVRHLFTEYGFPGALEHLT